MNNLQVILFVVAALVILGVWSKETFVPPAPDVSAVTDMFTDDDEYSDEGEEVVEYPDEEEAEEEVVEYPDEEEEFGGFDEPLFELSMKKIE